MDQRGNDSRKKENENLQIENALIVIENHHT